jgi:serine/threonine protein kinase
MISPGDRLDGKYRVVCRLGGGGFGEVFLAEDEKIPDRYVAIKVLKESPDSDQSDLLHEMQTLAKFHHSGVVAFYHHFRNESGLHLVMEYCRGGCLFDGLKQAGRFPEEQVFTWGRQLCETLAFVHDKGIVHHDIKPQNILFAADDTIKLGDFGIANTNAGTRIYLAPEVWLGEAKTRLDPRIDVYALGLTLLELLVGDNPFVGVEPDVALMMRVAHDFIPEHLPRWVQEVLLKATHPKSEMRFQTAADFAEAIRGKHVAYVFDRKRIEADALAEKAANALTRRKWKKADELCRFALDECPDCVSALTTAGRCQLLLHRIDRAKGYFTRALAVSRRSHVQKELGWIALEEGRLPAAISLLTDHLQRNALDYEAYNLLLKCFYLTDCYEACEDLTRTLMESNAPNECFTANRILSRLLADEFDPELLEAPLAARCEFVKYNVEVAMKDKLASWNNMKALKSKLLFEEFSFGLNRGKQHNEVSIYRPDGSREDRKHRIVTIGSSPSNDIRLEDKSVSRRHCVIVNLPDDVWLYDLGSTVGTVVDGERVTPRVHLDGVHEIDIGRVGIKVASRSDKLL